MGLAPGFGGGAALFIVGLEHILVVLLTRRNTHFNIMGLWGLFIICFGATPFSAQGLHLSLHSGITPGGAQETIWDV